MRNSSNNATGQTDDIEEDELIDYLIYICIYLAVIACTSRWTRVKYMAYRGGSMDNRIGRTRRGETEIVVRSSWENDYTTGKIDHGTWRNRMKLHMNLPRARVSKLISRAVRKDTGHEERLNVKTMDKVIKHEAMDVMHYNAVAIEIRTELVMEHNVSHNVSICIAVHRSTIEGATVKKGETGWRNSRCRGQGLYGT